MKRSMRPVGISGTRTISHSRARSWLGRISCCDTMRAAAAHYAPARPLSPRHNPCRRIAAGGSLPKVASARLDRLEFLLQEVQVLRDLHARSGLRLLPLDGSRDTEV